MNRFSNCLNCIQSDHIEVSSVFSSKLTVFSISLRIISPIDEPGKKATSKSYMWVYSSIKESKRPVKIFDYRPDRKATNPQEFLKGFDGTIITDGYYGYNHIDGVTNAYCWAHARSSMMLCL